MKPPTTLKPEPQTSTLKPYPLKTYINDIPIERKLRPCNLETEAEHISYNILHIEERDH